MQRYNAHVVSSACNACIPNMGWLQSTIWQVPEDASLDLKASYSAQIYQMIQVVQPEQSKMVQVPAGNFNGHWQRILWKETPRPRFQRRTTRHGCNEPLQL